MNKILKYTIIFATLLSFAGCKKFIDVNYNPNTNTKPKSDLIMSAALAQTYRLQVSSIINIIPGTWTGNYAHSTSFTGGGAEKTYEYTTADFDAYTGLFDNLSDYDYVIKHADADGVGFWKDAANVMQCYVYQQLIDLYGNVPYSQAFKGLDNVTPAFDNQQAIYEDLVVRLDAAIASIKATTWPSIATFTNQDVYFQGNKTKWVRFANTLKLRILMRQSFMPGRDTYITDNINSTVADGYLQENVLCQPGYATIAGKLNPFYANFGFNELGIIQSNYQYRKMNKVIVDWLKASNDSLRLIALVSPAATQPPTTVSLPLPSTINGVTYTTASYIGVPLGAGSGFATASASPIGPIQIQTPLGTRAGMLMLLAEANFLQAEARERYAGVTLPLTSKQYYEAGILAHYRTCAAPSTSGALVNTTIDGYAARYIARPVAYANWTASPNKIKAILLQKWVSLININGLEAWSEYRKASGTPDAGVPVGRTFKTVASTTNPEPARFLYPQTEYDINTNVPSGIDRFTSKIFWDVN